MPSFYSGLISLYVGVTLLGANGLFARTIPLDATSITHLRAVVAAAALLMFSLVRRRPFIASAPMGACLLYMLGILLALHWITFFHAMQVSSVAVGMLSLFAYPVITVCVEPLFHRHLPRWTDLAAAVVVVSGVLLLIPEWRWGSQTSEGVCWGVVSALAFSFRNILQRRFVDHLSSTTVMWHQTLAIALVVWPWNDWPAVLAMDMRGWLLLIGCGVFTTAAAHTLFSTGLRVMSAKSVGLISCLQPVVGVLLAWWVLHEQPYWRTFVGGGLIVVAAAYESWRVRG